MLHADASLSPRRLTRICIAAALVSLTGFVLSDNIAHASSYVVTTTADGGPGSLRDAVTQANLNPGPDTINVPAGTYTLTIAGVNEDANATGDLDITGETTIIGAGSGSTIIDANGIDRAFDLLGGPVTLQSLTVTNGSVAPGQSGGNVREQPYVDLTVADSVISNGTASYGGGIEGDKGVLTIVRSELVGNSIVGVSGNSGVGAAIYKGGTNQGSLSLIDSLVTGNHAGTNSAAIVYITAAATISNSTIANNTSESRIVVLEAQQSDNFAVSFDHVTIANNTSVNGGGAGLSINLIAPAVMPATITGSLFVNNFNGATSSNCAFAGNGGPAITSGDHNLSDDATCVGFTQSGDLPNNHATTLGALANNGGPTRTLALMTGSSAIDAAGACAAATPTDQRGVSRPKGVACDIGAFEADAPVDPTTTETPTTETPTTETPTTESPTTAAPGSTLVEPPTSVTQTTVGSGVVTTMPPDITMPLFYGGELPSTGSSHSGGLWLASLACSLGALLVLTARRRAR